MHDILLYATSMLVEIVPLTPGWDFPSWLHERYANNILNVDMLATEYFLIRRICIMFSLVYLWKSDQSTVLWILIVFLSIQISEACKHSGVQLMQVSNTVEVQIKDFVYLLIDMS